MLKAGYADNYKNSKVIAKVFRSITGSDILSEYE